MAALIQFRCCAIEHQKVAGLDVTVSPITLHEHRWAYCPLGVPEGHEWAKLEVGRSLDELRRTTFSERGSPLDASAAAVIRRGSVPRTSDERHLLAGRTR